VWKWKAHLDLSDGSGVFVMWCSAGRGYKPSIDPRFARANGAYATEPAGWLKDHELYLVIVNLSNSLGQAQVRVPWASASDARWRLSDLLSGRFTSATQMRWCRPSCTWNSGHGAITSSIVDSDRCIVRGAMKSHHFDSACCCFCSATICFNFSFCSLRIPCNFCT
jgi:hypothetical protein